MSDHDALLNAIAEHPEEDTPRLMYADWLEENGDPERADFVRVQVALAQPGLSGEERAALVLRHRPYLMGFERQWKASLPKIGGVEWGDFNRGLIEEVRAPSEQPVIDHAEEIFAVPGIHILRLWQLIYGAQLARVPELIRLRTLRIITYGTPAGILRALLASPHLRRLTALDLYGSQADNDVAVDIADGRFPDLAELVLTSTAVGEAGALALANSPHLDKLRLLDLRNCPIDGRSAAARALRKRFGKGVKMRGPT